MVKKLPPNTSDNEEKVQSLKKLSFKELSAYCDTLLDTGLPEGNRISELIDSLEPEQKKGMKKWKEHW